jgi:hypothetical protein
VADGSNAATLSALLDAGEISGRELTAQLL